METIDHHAPSHADTALDGFYTDCPCRRNRYRLNRVNHDFLTGIEAAGIAGAVELLDWVSNSVAEGEPCESELAWTDLVEFVSCHNWTDPTVMTELAALADEFGHALAASRT